jgi:3-hydroxyisobutyrate dehydrogenase-like beta-hydroxyacid dehydrogenase
MYELGNYRLWQNRPRSAKAFARKGIEVSVATTRDPESFAADAAAIGPKVLPRTLAEAVKADIIFLAVRFNAHRDVAKAHSRERSGCEGFSRGIWTRGGLRTRS